MRRWLGIWALVGSLGASAPARGAEHEILRMEEILAVVTDQTVVVFDLDNTLLRPSTGFGSDEWYYRLVEHYRKSPGVTEDQALAAAMALWNRVQRDLSVQPVEPGTPALLRGLQARGLTVLAVTARTHDIAEVTLGQLKSIGVELALPGRRRDWVLDRASHAELHGAVLFVGEQNDKGVMLARLLKRLDLRPQHLIFVDDKPSHVGNVDRALGKAGIAVDAFRYGGADAQVRAFRPEVADVQLAWWQRRVLSDEAATRLLKDTPPPVWPNVSLP